jgi:hypothetical protein
MHNQKAAAGRAPLMLLPNCEDILPTESADQRHYACLDLHVKHGAELPRSHGSAARNVSGRPATRSIAHVSRFRLPGWFGARYSVGMNRLTLHNRVLPRAIRAMLASRMQAALGAVLLAMLLPVATPAGADEPAFPFNPLPATVPVPSASDPHWSNNPIDAFVFARLRQAGLEPAPEIDRATYLRRATYDLLGLPPTPEERDTFVNDPRRDDEARAALVERLLASTHYGERMARMWLDVARYADTDGFAIDAERPTLWRYRDYVIRSFNADKPYAQFVREQLAGDLKAGAAEGAIATGFYRLGPWEADNMVPEHRRQDFLNEMTAAVGSVFLGLTLGCARCHDHKYDPVSMVDFYSIQAFLTPEDRAEPPAEFLAEELTPPVQRGLQAASEELARAQAQFAALLAELRAKLAPSLKKPPAEITEDQIEEAIESKNDALTEEEGKKFFEERKKLKQNRGQRYQPAAVGLKRLAADKIFAARLLRNGDPFDKAQEVAPGFLAAVAPWAGAPFETPAANPPETQRQQLADWVASPHNPLTARVFVNRIWQLHMGQGLVATSNDFGAAGSGVSHAGLLDFLARAFLDQGGSVKHLQRMLLLSRAYRTSTAHPSADLCRQVDPENKLCWRGPFKRLDAEGVRDALLALSGRLNREPGGPGFFEALPAGVETKYEFFEWPVSAPEERRRRSIYMFQRRNLVHPMMELFDVADANQPCERRRPSVTAPQVLTLLNGGLAREAALALAQRVRDRAGPDPAAQIEQAFLLAYNRAPLTGEREACQLYLAESIETPTAAPASADVASPRGAEAVVRGQGDGPLDARAAMPADRLVRLCLALLNANEFLYLD